jgi:hypothetical protein
MHRIQPIPIQFSITRLLSLLTLCFGLFSATPALGFEDSAVVAKAERGITGVYEFQYPGKPLQVKPQREVDAPLNVRLQRTNDNEAKYEARFIGAREGRFDLREYLEHVDGAPPIDLPLMPVQIVSMLPKDQRSDLFDSTVYRPRIMGGYRIAWILGILLWLAVPGVLWAIRYWNKPPLAPPKPVEKEITVAEQLRPLIEAASQRMLSTWEKGRLELLLYHFWRERGALTQENMADSIRKLRTLPEAGELIRAVESWLHSNPEDTQVDRSPEAILDILKPYQTSTDAVSGSALAYGNDRPVGQGVAR